MPSRRTFFYCPNEHLIGEMVRKDLHGEAVTALYVYEQSESLPKTESLQLPEKRSLIYGYAVVKCTICHCEKVWTVSNRTAIAMMIGLLNSLYEPAARKDMVKHG